jgi:ABC-2 type transport system ATP-binding protein
LTVRENLEFFAALENVSRREMKDRIESMLARTNLFDVANQQAMKLSSGTCQRLGIARALLKNPLILLLDEPTRSLDIAATTSLWDLVLEMSSTGITILLATHNFEEASAVCDRVAVLHKGDLIDRRVAHNLTAKQLRDFYLELTSEKQHPESFPEEVPA